MLGSRSESLLAYPLASQLVFLSESQLVFQSESLLAYPLVYQLVFP